MNKAYSKAKEKAKYRNIAFELTEQEFEQLKHDRCYFCQEKDDENNSIKRIDVLYGFSVNNCLPVCKACYKMMSFNSIKEFVERCKKIASCF